MGTMKHFAKDQLLRIKIEISDTILKVFFVC